MEDISGRATGSAFPWRLAVPRRGPLATAMLAGIGVTILLWLVAGFDLVWRYEQVDDEVNAVTDRVFRSEQALEAIRTNVLLGAIDWRDALLDPGGSEQTDAYLAKLREYRKSCAKGLDELRVAWEPIGTSGPMAELAGELDEYWASVMPIVTLASVQRAGDIRRIMQDRVRPRRANVERIAVQIGSLNRLHLLQQHRREAEVYARSRTRFLLTGGLALMLSLGVGAFVTNYVGRLERALRAQVEANAQNAADLHRLSGRLVGAQEDERRLIARELHDEVGQALTAVKLQLSVARRSVPPAETGAIDEARTIVDAALQSARQLSRLLRPPMLDDMGLGPALDSYLTAFGERTGIATDLVHAGLDDRPAPEIEIGLFRIVQEATTNIARHASATSCRVYVQRLPDSVVLTVEDNGRGFNARTERLGTEEGLGLLGIRERVADARGTFGVESSPDRGTRLSVELPALSHGSAETRHGNTDHGDAVDMKEASDGTHPARG